MTARELALSQPDLAPRPVFVPEWGTTVYVKPLDGFDLARFFGQGGDEALSDLARLVVFTATDADGVRVFRDDDLPALRKKPQTAIVRLAGEAIEVNQLGADAAKKGSGTPDTSANSD